MKSVYIFVIAIFLSFSSIFSQSYNNKLLYKTFDYADIQNQYSTSELLEFDGPNKRIMEVWQTWSLSHYRWENYKMYDFVYPINKVSSTNATLFRRKTTFGWQNENWENQGWWEIFVDADGYIEQEVSYDNFGGVHQVIDYFGPHTNGRAAYYISKIENVNSQRISYTYTADGDIAEMTSEAWDGNNWVYDWRGIATYNNPGCQATWTNYNYDNGNWIAERRTTNGYDRADCTTEMVIFQPWPLRDCNPTQIINEISADNGATWTESTTETFSDFGGDCLPRTSINNTNGYQERVLFEFSPIPGAKLSSPYDNSNLRCTKKTTQYFKDNAWVNSDKYWYSYEGLLLDINSDESVPDKFNLQQNYPNPFNPITTINFSLAEDSEVKLSIYDMSGRLINELIRDELNIGNHSIDWNGEDINGNQVGAGIYIYSIDMNDKTLSKKMILMK